MTESKTCSKCGETKPLTAFSRRTDRASGYQSQCKACQDAYLTSRPFYMPTQNAKRRARNAGIPFSLTEKYLEDIWTGVCPVFGTRLALPLSTKHPDVDATSAHQPSLDRVIPERGYVEGNVVWLSRRANVIKSYATSAEIRAVADWLLETEKEIERHEAD